QDPELTRELVLDHPEYDVTGSLIYSRTQKEVVGVSYADERGSLFFDDSLQVLQESINKLMPNTSNYITDISDDLGHYLLYTTGPQESGTYYKGQRKPPELQAIAYRYQKLSPDLLANTQRYGYKARDGL